jgi:hypothetical protein
MVNLEILYAVWWHSKIWVIPAPGPHVDHYAGSDQFGRRDLVHASARRLEMRRGIQMRASVLRKR